MLRVSPDESIWNRSLVAGLEACGFGKVPRRV